MAEHLRVATLIGDVVASRRAPDRTRMQGSLREALEAVNAAVPATQPLDVTVGDEFQGAYGSVAAAARAALLLRLTLLPGVDTRYGLGWGGISVFDADRALPSQDGPGWWAAREAIEHVDATAGRRGRARGMATWFVDHGATAWPAGADAPPAAPAVAGAVNGLLLLRDELVAQQSDRARRLLLGWLRGRQQQELAADEGITQSAVSQQLARSGAYAVRDALDALDGVAAWSS